MITTYIKVEGVWVEGAPVIGELVRHTYPNGHSVEKTHELAMIQVIRLISKRAFMQRLTQVERIAIRKSEDDIIVDIHEDLLIASHVDLDLPELQQALNYMMSVGLLQYSRIAELLVDGTLRESYP
jgi:hypothetical protein